MKKMTAPKAAIIGTGWIARVHGQALKSAGIPIAAVVGSSHKKAEAFAAEFRIPSYGTDFSVLKEADVVHICTPPADHAGQIALLLQQGKHIFCEKPMTLDPVEAEQLAALAREKGLLCAVGFNLRFYPALQRARELVSSPEFGRPLLIHGSYLQEFGAEPAEYSWRYEDPLHAVSEIGSHWLDLARFVSGREIIALSALFDRFQPQRHRSEGKLFLSPCSGSSPCTVTSEDSAVLSLRFEGGIIGSVVLSELSHGRENRLILEITGTHQTLSWSSESPERLYLAEKGTSRFLTFCGDFQETFSAEIRAFYAAVQEKAAQLSPCADFTEGSRNVLLCHLAKESADQNGQWKEVAL